MDLLESEANWDRELSSHVRSGILTSIVYHIKLIFPKYQTAHLQRRNTNSKNMKPLKSSIQTDGRNRYNEQPNQATSHLHGKSETVRWVAGNSCGPSFRIDVCPFSHEIHVHRIFQWDGFSILDFIFPLPNTVVVWIKWEVSLSDLFWQIIYL